MISRTILRMTMLPVGLRSRMARRLRGRISAANLGALVRSLGDESEVIRSVSLESLVFSEAAGAKALIARAGDESSRMRSRIAGGLGRFSRSTPAIRTLTKLLQDPSAPVRAAAASSLGEIGTAAASAIDFLKKQAKGNDLHAAVAAVTALGRIDVGGASSLPVLISLIDHSDRLIRLAVINAMGSVIASSPAGLNASELMSLLLPLIKHRDPALREVAARLLANLGPDAIEAIPQLILLSRDQSVGVRLAVASALTAIAPQDPQIFLVLIALTQDKEWSIRE